jgi:hypothetical protein
MEGDMKKATTMPTLAELKKQKFDESKFIIIRGISNKNVANRPLSTPKSVRKK